MQRLMTVFFLASAAIELSNCLTSESKQTRFFNANPRAIDYKFVGKNEEHRYGVELRENKQFHHTKTEEDGVRLGCYGHEQDGKKYLTHYVADSKGYRLVPDQGLITVYPKDGGEARKASFTQSFNEDELSANIGSSYYLFPDGCSLGKFEEISTIPPIVKKVEAIKYPESTTELFLETTTLQDEVCSHECCDDDLARIILSTSKSGVSKLVIPLQTTMLSNCTISEIVEVISETDSVMMLKKLLRLAIRYI